MIVLFDNIHAISYYLGGGSRPAPPLNTRNIFIWGGTAPHPPRTPTPTHPRWGSRPARRVQAPTLPLTDPPSFLPRPSPVPSPNPHPPLGGPSFPASPHPAHTTPHTTPHAPRPTPYAPRPTPHALRSPSQGKFRAPACLPPRLCAWRASHPPARTMWPHALRGGRSVHRHVYPCGCEHGASCRNQSPRPHTWSGMYSDVRSDSRLSKPFFEMRFLRTLL